MKIGIIGCGLIGWKRALSIKSNQIYSVCDIDISKAQKLAKTINCNFTDNYNDITNNDDIDAVIVSTPNYLMKEIVVKALKNNKHVLSEKPLGKNSKESQKMQSVANKNKKVLYTGFNHRFHPSIIKAKKLIDDNLIGDILHIHGHYGHGGREGMEKEWRMDKKLSGGGELLDQGVHLVDLAILFKGFPKKVFGANAKLAWDSSVEDSSSFILLYEKNINCLFSVGWIYWKNKFEFSIYGSEGFIAMHGLGGSYGDEKLTLGIRNRKGGKPKIRKFSFQNKVDLSWRKEWNHFKNLIKNNTQCTNGHEANLVIDSIYQSNQNKNVISL